MNTAQLSSAHLSRKANKYKSERNEKQINTKSKEMRSEKRHKANEYSSAQLSCKANKYNNK